MVLGLLAAPFRQFANARISGEDEFARAERIPLEIRAIGGKNLPTGYRFA